ASLLLGWLYVCSRPYVHFGRADRQRATIAAVGAAVEGPGTPPVQRVRRRHQDDGVFLVQLQVEGVELLAVGHDEDSALLRQQRPELLRGDRSAVGRVRFDVLGGQFRLRQQQGRDRDLHLG